MSIERTPLAQRAFEATMSAHFDDPGTGLLSNSEARRLHDAEDPIAEFARMIEEAAKK